MLESLLRWLLGCRPKGQQEEVQHTGEVNALERLMAKKRKSETPSVAHAFMKPDQQLKAREALADFFLEASDAVAVNLIGHSALLKFCALVGIKPMTRQVILQQITVTINCVASFMCDADLDQQASGQKI